MFYCFTPGLLCTLCDVISAELYGMDDLIRTDCLSEWTFTFLHVAEDFILGLWLGTYSTAQVYIVISMYTYWVTLTLDPCPWWC